MSIFNIFKRKEAKSYSFGDEDRQFSLEKRRANAELTKIRNEIALEKEKYQLEKAKLELKELRSQMSDFDDSDDSQSPNVENLLLTAVLGFMNKQQQPMQQQPVTTSASVESIKLSDEDILNILHSLPKKYISIGKKLSDNNLLNIIYKQMPNISETDAKRVLTHFRNSF